MIDIVHTVSSMLFIALVPLPNFPLWQDYGRKTL